MCDYEVYLRDGLADAEQQCAAMEEITRLRAEVARLQLSSYFERESAKDANAQLNTVRADRDRCKAWHDEVMNEPHWHGGYSTVICRPQPLKENE